MNKKFINVTINLFKASLLVIFSLLIFQGCKKEEPNILIHPVNNYNVDSVYTITNIPLTDNIIKFKAVLNKKYAGLIKLARFEYSTSSYFNEKDSVCFSHEKLDNLDSIGFTTKPRFFNETLFVRLLITDNNYNVTQSKTITVKTCPFPTLTGSKFVLGYNDSLFTIEMDGSNRRYLGRAKNISRNGKVIQIGRGGLQNLDTYNVIRRESSKVFESILDFSNTGSIVVWLDFSRYNTFKGLNNGIEMPYINNLPIGFCEEIRLSPDETKLICSSSTETIIIDMTTKISTYIGFGGGTLSKDNLKMVASSGLAYPENQTSYTFAGSLIIFDPIDDGISKTAKTLIKYNSQVQTQRFLTFNPIFSDDESIVYFLDEDQDIYSIPTAGGNPTKLTNQPVKFSLERNGWLFKLVNF